MQRRNFFQTPLTWPYLLTMMRGRLRLKGLSLVLLGCIMAVALLWPTAPTMSADWFDIFDGPRDLALDMMSWVAYFLLVVVMGKLAIIATNVLIYTAQLNNFTDLPVIIEAWTTVRDFSNMFFIVVLLVIAFGTLFQLEAYSWKKLLPKMILAAVLINYSRAICGVIVDASQVIMLTFVTAIADAAHVGLTEAFSLDKLLDFGKTTGVDAEGKTLNTVNTTSGERLLAIVAAGMMLATLFSIQCVYIVVLVGRLAMIWFLTVLSPLPYLTMILPQTQKYSSQWWEMFGRFVTVGPLMMFFLWLSMFIAAKSAESGGLGVIANPEGLQSQEAQNAVSHGAAALDTTLLSGFVIATMMLAAGVKLAQDNSSELGEYTGKASNFGKWVTTKPFIAGASYVNDVQFAHGWTPLDFNAPRVINRWKHGLEKVQKDRVTKGESLAAARYNEGYLLAGVFGAGDQVAEQGLIDTDGRKLGQQLRGGVLGNIPVLRHWKGARRMLSLGDKHAQFEEAMEHEDTAKKEQLKAETTLKEEKEKVRKNGGNDLMTTGEYAEKINNLEERDSTLSTLNAGDTLEIKNENHRHLLEQYRTQLEAEAKDPMKTDTQREEAATRLDKLNDVLSDGFLKRSKDGKVDEAMQMEFITPSDLATLLKSTQGQATKELADMRASGNARTNNFQFQNENDIQDHIKANDDVKKLQKEADNKEKAHKAAVHHRKDLGPQTGFAAEIKLRKLINEAASDITSEDTAELCDGFEDALHKGSDFGPEALAYYDRLAATNNVNDILVLLKDDLKAIDPTIENPYSMKGMKALEKLMVQRTGLPEQAVRATLHRGFQKMKSLGNTFMSEMSEAKNGQFEWRDEEDWKRISVIENRKRNASQQLSNATRLQLGDGPDFYEEQRFTLENFSTLMAPALKSDKTLNINSDVIRHLETDARRYHVMRNKVLNTVADKDTREQVIKAFNRSLRSQGIKVSAKYDSANPNTAVGKEKAEFGNF